MILNVMFDVRFICIIDATLYLATPKRAISRHIEQPQLKKTLVRGVMVDISVIAIHQVLFHLDYIDPASTIECDFRLRVVYDRYVIRGAENRHERVEMTRWIIDYISLLVNEIYWVEV